MRSLAPSIGLCTAVALLSGCSAIHAAAQNATDGFHTGFRSSFKTSFIKSCTRQGTSEKLCTCVEGKIAAANTDDQLMKLTADDDATRWMLQKAARACAAGK
jgi:hypothetical protein